MNFYEEEWDDLENYRESLEHYGVLGMKWGVRKDRKSSGSSSMSSKKKAKVQSRMTFLERRKAEREKKAEEEAKKKEEAKAKKEAAKREAALKSPTKLYKNRDKFTQDEINAALKRFEWEKKLSDYSTAELRAGQKYIDTAFQYAVSSINLYNQAARVVNSFNLSEKPWKYVENPTSGDNKKKK